MNEELFKQWCVDAKRALSGRYTEPETEIIVEWFSRIKASDERRLIGDNGIESMLEFFNSAGYVDVYSSMMCRLFIYAPLILKEHSLELTQSSTFNI